MPSPWVCTGSACPGEDIAAIGYQRCEDQRCFAPGKDVYPHLHPETVLIRHENGTLDGFG